MSNQGFSKVISQFRADAIAACRETRKAATIELFRSVILDTPVLEGRLRANWQASINNPATGQQDIFDENGGGTVVLAIQTVNQSADDQSLWLVNNLPYAMSIEYGSSDKAPQGMVRKNMARVQRLIEREARRRRI